MSRQLSQAERGLFDAIPARRTKQITGAEVAKLKAAANA